MSSFDSGSDGSLIADNLLDALFDLIGMLKIQEQTDPNNALNNVNFTTNFNTKVLALSATIPITSQLSSTGQVSISAVNYLAENSINSDFQNGGGDIKSSNTPGAFLEICQMVHQAEKADTVNNPNRIEIIYDLENELATISGSFPFTYIRAGRSINVESVDYLPTSPTA